MHFSFRYFWHGGCSYVPDALVHFGTLPLEASAPSLLFLLHCDRVAGEANAIFHVRLCVSYVWVSLEALFSGQPHITQIFISWFSITTVAFSITLLFDLCFSCDLVIPRIGISILCLLHQILLDHIFQACVVLWLVLMFNILWLYRATVIKICMYIPECNLEEFLLWIGVRHSISYHIFERRLHRE